MSETIVCVFAIINVLTVCLNVKIYTEIMKEKCQSVRRPPPGKGEAGRE